MRSRSCRGVNVNRQCLPNEHEPRDLGVDLIQLPRGDGRNLNWAALAMRPAISSRLKPRCWAFLIIRSSVTVQTGYCR